MSVIGSISWVTATQGTCTQYVIINGSYLQAAILF